MPVRRFFRGTTDFFAFDRLLLGRCRGDVLDLGAAAGSFSLALQDLRVQVSAVDACPRACGVMRRRGVRRVLEYDISRLVPTAQTLVLVMNTLGIFGTVKQLDNFLGRASGCQRILLDAFAPAHGDVLEECLCTQYRGELGEPFGWLSVSSTLLAERARRTGWRLEVLAREEHGAYAAELTRV